MIEPLLGVSCFLSFNGPIFFRTSGWLKGTPRPRYSYSDQPEAESLLLRSAHFSGNASSILKLIAALVVEGVAPTRYAILGCTIPESNFADKLSRASARRIAGSGLWRNSPGLGSRTKIGAFVFSKH